jgi:hypothetical protein
MIFGQKTWQPSVEASSERTFLSPVDSWLYQVSGGGRICRRFLAATKVVACYCRLDSTCGEREALAWQPAQRVASIAARRWWGSRGRQRLMLTNGTEVRAGDELKA